MENCYQILGVSVHASLSEIKHAYRELAKQYHPDSSGNQDPKLAEKFDRITQAYRVLSDQRQRQIFDDSFFNHFRRSSVKDESFDYRKWLIERNDDESWAKLIILDLMRGREDEACAEFKKIQSERNSFKLKDWFTREDFMDYGYILSEELVIRGEYYDAFLLLEQVILIEKSYSYFGLFFPEVISFVQNIVMHNIFTIVNDELALDVFERTLDLELGNDIDRFCLQKMALIYRQMGDTYTAAVCEEEASKI